MRSDRAGSVPKSLTTEEALFLLAIEPKDAGALVTIYDNHGRRLRRTATRLFGRDPEVAARVVNSILVAIGREAATYDPQTMSAGEWVRRCANAEARRLREVLDAGNNRGRRTRRPM
jgi:DNA-directed RNA polymerase specialized sigma24 family protein